MSAGSMGKPLFGLLHHAPLAGDVQLDSHPEMKARSMAIRAPKQEISNTRVFVKGVSCNAIAH